MLDERHAALVEVVVSLLRSVGWDPLVEVSFNHYGDRGSIDVLAVHALTRCGLVVEVKSELTAIEETNRRLDVKVRLAPSLVAERFGIRPVAVGRLLVLPRTTTSFRRVASVAATFHAVIPAPTVEARRWLRQPAGPFAGIAVVPISNRRSARSGGRLPAAASPSGSPRNPRPRVPASDRVRMR
jgi:hypothetical protein